MGAEVDTRHCPVCGHDTLDWDVPCPGCDQVPWDSPVGRRVIRRRRFWDTWSTGLPIAGLLALVLAVVIIGNLSLTRHLEQRRERAGGLPALERLRDELVRLLDTSRLDERWKADLSVVRAIEPYETAVREAQSELLGTMRQVGQVAYGVQHMPPRDQTRLAARYEAAIKRLRRTWAAYERVRGRLEVPQ